MFGFQASGAAPIVTGEPVLQPQTIATAIRIGNPASWRLAEAARDESGGLIDSVTDREILAAYRLLATREAVFGELASVGQRGRPAEVLRRRPDPGWLPGGLHHHRQRPEGPRLGPVRRPRPRPPSPPTRAPPPPPSAWPSRTARARNAAATDRRHPPRRPRHMLRRYGSEDDPWAES